MTLYPPPPRFKRSDMGDVHNDNPSEEVNIFDKPGAFYGYPYCWWVSHNFPVRAQSCELREFHG